MSDVTEGYVFNAYGKIDYLKYVFASISTIRRYDNTRKVALYCSDEQIQFLKEEGLDQFFDILEILPKAHQSITGFKHNTHLFSPFDRNLFLDSDIIMLKNPDSLWHHFSGMGYAVTGLEVSDIYFGTHKSALAFLELFLQRRRRTLKRFGLTQLSRVQSGVIFVSDKEEARQINEKAQYFLANQSKTHFRSRTKEKGRSEESCEWSLAMALSYFNVSVFPWFWAENSAQLDFIEAYTKFDSDFSEVSCKYYFDPFTYSFRGLKTGWIRNSLHFIFSWVPGKDDHTWITPYMIHFGWMHQKQPFYEFADKVWAQIKNSGKLSA